MERPSAFVLELMEKLTRAKVMVEGLKKEHTSQCASEIGDGPGPCNCGASDHNRKIDTILSILKIT